MRILLFLATNLAVILVASFTLRLLGVDSYLAQNGIDYGSRWRLRLYSALPAPLYRC